mmetsp:Transcript_36890/g.98269  ORF Transcript_36890/g.98269 Transcript_36890/m.98269 type:complete len:88 (-) Transcript_36890:35-298(-)
MGATQAAVRRTARRWSSRGAHAGDLSEMTQSVPMRRSLKVCADGGERNQAWTNAASPFEVEGSVMCMLVHFFHRAVPQAQRPRLNTV